MLLSVNGEAPGIATGGRSKITLAAVSSERAYCPLSLCIFRARCLERSLLLPRPASHMTEYQPLIRMGRRGSEDI